MTRPGRALDVRLYVVTDPALTPPDVVVERVLAAVAGGATLVQLRDKDATHEKLTSTARSLAAALRPTGVPLIVNDDVEAAHATGAAGVHVGVGDLPPARARERLGPEAIIGWSVEDVRQLDDAESLAACDYVAASPVWSTPTKTDTAPELGLAGVGAIRSGTVLPVVGIGRISTPALAADVIRAGADGVAVVSAVFGVTDIAAAARDLRTALDNAAQRETR